MLADKRERFELMMQQAEVPAEIIQTYFHEGYIEQVEVSRSGRSWTFLIKKRELVPRQVYLAFCQRIRERFAHIAHVRFIIHFGDEVENQILVKEYWPLLIEWLQREQPSVNGWMNKASKEIHDQRITVELLDRTGMELAKKKKIDEMIEQFYDQYFGRSFQVGFSLSESNEDIYEQFAQQIEEEERSFTQSLLQSIEQESELPLAPSEVTLSFGYNIKDAPTPIQSIQDEEKKTTIQGCVLGFEQKELRSGNTLFQFIITDFTD